MPSVASQPSASLSLEEWSALDEDAGGELVDGRIEEDEVAGFAHEVVVAWLLTTLFAWARSVGARVVGSDAKLAVTPTRGRKADLIAYLAGARRPSGHGLVRVAPDVVIEVVSPSPSDARRDRIEKMNDYAAFGVRWYWLVDPQLRTVEIHELGGDGRYVRAAAASEGTIDPVPGCDGLRISLDEMWADLDAALAESGER